MVYRFDDCSLDTQRHRLQHAGQPVRLRSKAFQVLRYLLEHRDRTVLKQELYEQVWPQQFISEATLESTVRAVRQAIGDSGHRQELIQTVYGYGYCFSAAVVEGVDPSGGTAGEAMRAHPDVALVALMSGSVDEADDAPATAPRAEAGLAPQPEPPRRRDTVLAGEWKVVTVLCCALAKAPVGSVPPGAEEGSQQVRALYVLARDTVQRYEGILRPVMGESIIAVFGAPAAQEDHAQRAVLAGLELQRRLRDAQDEALEVRMGLHTALVTVGGVGDDSGATVAVVGEAVARAAALQEQATRGVILCSEATARLVQEVVRVAALVPVPMAGEATSVPTYTVFGRRGRRQPLIRRGQMGVRTPFLGRPRELATLRALWRQAQEGRGQVVGVVGEPGIGKSRLVYECRRSLGGRSMTYLTSSCRSHGAATPYLPILDLLRQTCGITDRDDSGAIMAKVHASLSEVGLVPGPWAPYLLQLLEVPAGTDLPATLSPQAVKARSTEAFVQLALQGARERPLVLEVEDLHWIDPSSEEVFAALVERLVDARILLLLTYRPGYRPRWIDRSYATQLALMRLRPRESRRLVQAIIRTVAVPDVVVQAILVQAEGNPLFLEELARAAVELGDRPRTMVLPTTIQSVLDARIDRLPPEEKQLLQVAAVIGRDIAVPLLEAVAEVPAAVLQRSLAHLQAMELLYETTRVVDRIVTFKHALTREAAYRSLLASTRQQYHQRIAQVVEARFPETTETQPELLAHHYTEAGLNARAMVYWQRAGERALQRSANVEAIAHLTRGIEGLKTLPDTPERRRQELHLQLALGTALVVTHGYAAPAVEQVYTRAYTLGQHVDDLPRLLPILRGLVEVYNVRKEFYKARELGEQYLTMAQRTEDAGLLVDAYYVLGLTLFYLGELPAARAHFEQGLALYDPQRSRSSAPLLDSGVACLAFLTLVLAMLGYPDQALQSSHASLTLAHDLSHPYSLACARYRVGLYQQFLGQAQAAQEQAEATIALAMEKGFAFFVAVGIALKGRALSMQGYGPEGLAYIRQGLTALQATGATPGAHWLVLQAEAYWQDGQTAEGLRMLAEALAFMHTTGEQNYAAELYRLKGELLLSLSADNQSVAETCFQQSLAIAHRQHAKLLELRAAVSLSRLWQQQGKRIEASELLAPIYGWFTEGFDTADLQEAKALLEELS